jgi:hypothetical protein
MQLVINLPTKRGDKVGQRSVKAITPLAADKIYEQVCAGPNCARPRQWREGSGAVPRRVARSASLASGLF